MTKPSDDSKKTFEKWFRRGLALLKDRMPKTASALDEALIEKDAFEGSSRYKEQLEKLCDNVRIFGMSEPVPLRKIFIRVNILDKINAHLTIDSKTLEEWEDALRKGERRYGQVQETKEGLEAVKKRPKMIVLGKPGAGKTTFLKRVALHALDGDLSEERIPIFINLKEWSESKKSLAAFIVQQFAICRFSYAGPFIKLMLEEGRCLLLMDGFDEVTENVSGAIRKIKNFSNKYSNNQFVLSCRIAAWNYVFEQFTDVEMADFNDEQIHSFIRNWFGEQKKKSNSCWKSMQEKPPIKELATNPLLLTMLCLSFADTMDFPTNRSELYDDAVNALLFRWDSSKDIQRLDIYKNLSRNRKVELLCEIAYNTFLHGEYFIEQKRLEKEIADYICHLPQTSEESIDIDSKRAIKSIESQHGLIVERAKKYYSFSHLSFHEYFSARYIVDYLNQEKLNSLLDQHAFNPAWKEVFILTAGMLRNADAFLLKLRSKIGELADAKLKRYLKNAEKAIISCENVPASLCRILAFVSKIVLDFNESDQKYFSNIVTHSWNIARILSRACSAVLDLNIEVDADIVKKLHKEKISSLEPYIMAMELLVECLNAECYLSRDVRNHLLNGLLIEPSEFQPEKKEKKPSWNSLEPLATSKDEDDENTIVVPLPDLPKNAKPLVFVRIPAGEFMMGSPDDERGRINSEGPRRRVVIPNDFYIGKYPITQAQWEAVMKANPSRFEGNPNHPVETVSWDDCQEFRKKINAIKIGAFRLPSEAEWEYACRAGTSTRFYWGDDPDYKEIFKNAWCVLNSPIQTHEVGLLQPNPWGLHDMSGNVWEWCEDHWHENYKGAPEDNRAWMKSDKSSGSYRVLRGGSWDGPPWDCRSAKRSGGNPDNRNSFIGFRVVYSRT